MSHDDLCLLLRYLRSEIGLDADELIRVVEKPWHWTAELAEARAAFEGANDAGTDTETRRRSPQPV